MSRFLLLQGGYQRDQPPECNEDDILSSIFASVYCSNVTSVDEASGPISQLSLFPYPTSDVVNVAFELAESAPVRLAVHDLMGRLVLDSWDEHLPAGNQQKQLNINTLVT